MCGFERSQGSFFFHHVLSKEEGWSGEEGGRDAALRTCPLVFKSFIRGSSSGIGAATALLFAKKGASVTITGRNSAGIQRTHGNILSIGVPEERVHVVLGDVTDDEVRKRIVESTVARWGHLDILVNNAAASITNGKRGFEADDDAYVKTMDVNLRSVIELVRIARPHLIRSKGEIVNVSSIAALNFGIKHDPYYSISKAGLDQLTRALAIDLIEYEVRVNGVSPGIVETNFMENNGLTKEQADKVYTILTVIVKLFVEDRDPSEPVYKFYGSQRNAVPRGSNGNPQEIANVIAFLADRKMSSYIVGQMIVADGGTSLIMGAYTYDFDKVLSS